MQDIGMCKREREAEILNIPGPIQAAMPVEVVKSLFDGVLKVGFGLGGGIGCGKTMAIAAIFKEGLRRHADRSFKKTGCLPAGSKAVWVSWPEESIWITANPDKANSRCEHLSTCGLLVLDDLGRDRVKGAYSDDWAASRLDAVVSHRNRERLPILWTTNLDYDGIVSTYGASFASRLCQDNPLIWLA